DKVSRPARRSSAGRRTGEEDGMERSIDRSLRGVRAGAPLLYWSSALSLAAGVIHLLITPDNFEEWWGYGLFFLAVAVVQLSFGALLLRMWWTAGASGRGGVGPADQRREVFLAAAIVNVALIGLFVLSRTVGVPVL